MRKMPIPDNNYTYLCDDNILINNQFEHIYMKNSEINKQTTFKDVKISQNQIKSKVKQLQQLIFETTQNCNLRCKYCCYSESYPENRDFTPHSMTQEVAKKCIDSIREVIIDRPMKSLAASFYGGEPLLNYKLVKYIAAYLKTSFPGWDLSFHMTTNLTVLNDEILTFLAENGFRIIVSLDGPEKIHNAKRVFANDRGTFETVRKNLETIRTQFPDFYSKSISFISTHSKDLPYDELLDFFKNDPLVNAHYHRLTMVDENNSTYYENYPFSDEKNSMDLMRIRNNIINSVKENKELQPIENSFMNTIINTGESLKLDGITSLSSTCLFDSRVYLNALGEFYICEKANSSLSIGNMEEGFDFEKMEKIVTAFTETIKKHCAPCEAKYLCTQCFASIVQGEGFAVNEKMCSEIKRSIPAILKTYIEYKSQEN